MPETAFILVGGLGTRLRSVVAEVPKPMAPVAGRPFLERLLDYLLSQGVIDIILCVGHRRRVIEDYFGDSYRGNRVRYSIEEELLGTGGALSKALVTFGPARPFVVANGDTYFPINLSRLTDVLGDNSWAIASFETTDSGRYGEVRVGPGGDILNLLQYEASQFPEMGRQFQANSGLWIGNPDRISVPLVPGDTNYSRETYLSQGIRLKTATAIARQFKSPFIDIGLPGDLLRAQTLFDSSR